MTSQMHKLKKIYTKIVNLKFNIMKNTLTVYASVFSLSKYLKYNPLQISII